tara:strand:+ start:30227 stop:30496 length:270 start_codon:yes stop_codon:yes gene_type:complete
MYLSVEVRILPPKPINTVEERSMEGALWLIMAKFYSAFAVIYLMGPQLLKAFNDYKKANQLRSQIHYLTGAFVLMLILAAMAFQGPSVV